MSFEGDRTVKESWGVEWELREALGLSQATAPEIKRSRGDGRSLLRMIRKVALLFGTARSRFIFLKCSGDRVL
ncbi:hypothetical protein [Calothrix sp. CCY 0018]|uniref:hypothetical protein n=1 Tax=Calothrix sp. CCY 0018 TaxID=3103864 RepID=UPI0039C6EAD1